MSCIYVPHRLLKEDYNLALRSYNKEELHEQRTKSADEFTDGSTNEQPLEDPKEHPSDSWNLLKKLLSKEFNMKDLGSTKKILGMEIHRDRKAGKLCVAQKSYVEKVLERFSMLNAKPSTTTLSTTEAEYMALTKAAKEALWLKGLVEELGFQQHGVLLRCDSQNAMDLAKNQVFHARTKHIDVCYHRVWEWINSRQIVLHKVHINDNAANMLTKTAMTEKFKHCVSLIHLLSY
ncbi:hypothetical protein RJ639_037423 [Escallonia herrerae]|uniref:Reverse transcriptase Ty1/copia-type domain-containing protein n=1 Tax=Escallonia herrerae TaxID=1293975 RepID=A0AA88WSY6_9ASTE|nr:hypothetical protein RJ639_037423 [Escallonia herrerae]